AKAQNSMAVSWTAPADAPSGGAATLYDLRFSNAPLTAETFSAGTQIPTQPPGAPGTSEGVAISGLVPCPNYYRAIKSVDANQNVSNISNLPIETTKCIGPGDIMCGNGFGATRIDSGDSSMQPSLRLSSKASGHIDCEVVLPAATTARLDLLDVAG